MIDEPRILTAEETASRRAQQAASGPDRPIAMCAHSGCPRAAHWGPHCDDHRQFTPRGPVVAPDLTPTEIDTIRAEVAAKAAPLFLLAMDWILRQQLAREGLQLPPVIAVAREEPA